MSCATPPARRKRARHNPSECTIPAEKRQKKSNSKGAMGRGEGKDAVLRFYHGRVELEEEEWLGLSRKKWAEQDMRWGPLPSHPSHPGYERRHRNEGELGRSLQVEDHAGQERELWQLMGSTRSALLRDAFEEQLQQQDLCLSPNSRQIYDSNRHVRQCYAAGTCPIVQERSLCSCDRILHAGSGRRNYLRDRGGRTVEHWGQRKLMVAEMELMTELYQELDTVLYVGAAPGTHINLLAALFPRLMFVLVDPREMHVLSTDTVKVVQGYFDNAMAEAWGRRVAQGERVLFISDVRQLDGCTGPAEVEQRIMSDMQSQQGWLGRMLPPYAMLKLRLPAVKGSTWYVAGQVRLPVWGGHTTTESRLVVRRIHPPRTQNLHQVEVNEEELLENVKDEARNGLQSHQCVASCPARLHPDCFLHPPRRPWRSRNLVEEQTYSDKEKKENYEGERKAEMEEEDGEKEEEWGQKESACWDRSGEDVTTDPTKKIAEGREEDRWMEVVEREYGALWYDHNAYRDAMYFFNTVTRPSCYLAGFEVDHMDQCYDCAAEKAIICEYLDTSSANRKGEEQFVEGVAAGTARRVGEMVDLLSFHCNDSGRTLAGLGEGRGVRAEDEEEWGEDGEEGPPEGFFDT
tara:strand:- start:77 stop:1969 length:1893 start_codon:yes stop_codon:yes gene_type:complete